MSKVSPLVRRVCAERDMEMCVRCPGGRRCTDLHHRRPRAMGSSDRGSTNLPSNLVYLCRECHQWVESNRAQAISDGYIVMQGSEPSTVPILIRGQWYLLDDLGARNKTQ